MRIAPTIFAKSIDLADLVDVEDVEVVQTGIEYALASGPRTFTVDDLADAVAAQDDPAVKTPRIKLGHVQALGIEDDGAPAVGTVTDMKLEQGGHLITGTLRQIPEWLATVLPSAYPARSIEGANEVQTVTGNYWQLVITDLALLGVVWPGVTTLEDIQGLYSKDGPEGVKVLTTKEEVAAMSVAAAAAVTAQVDVDNVMREWNNVRRADSAKMWWWTRAMLMDPNELIVEDEEVGELYRVPYTIKGDDVTFAEPIAVKIEYKDKPKPKEDKEAASIAANAALAGLSAARPAQKTIAKFQTREESMGAVNSELDPVALRQALGLDDDATDEQVQQTLAAAGFITPPGSGGTGAPASEQPGTQPTGQAGQPDNEAPGNAGNDPGTGQPSVTPAPAPAPAGTVPTPTAASGIRTLDEATYNQLVQDAQAGRQAFTRQVTGDRNEIISAAIQAGKISPSRRDFWLKKFDTDEEEARTLLTASVDKGGISPGLIPVSQIGNEQPTEDTTIEAYPKEWLPDVHQPGNLKAQRGGVIGHE